MTMTKKSGFTLVEIMIVVLIIGLLAAIAVPNFVKARKSAQRNACIDNLRQIEGAVEQAKMDGKAAPEAGDIYGSDKYIKTPPVCPSTKEGYTISGTDEEDWRPECPNPTVNGSGADEKHELPSGEAGGEGEGNGNG